MQSQSFKEENHKQQSGNDEKEEETISFQDAGKEMIKVLSNNHTKWIKTKFPPYLSKAIDHLRNNRSTQIGNDYNDIFDILIPNLTMVTLLGLREEVQEKAYKQIKDASQDIVIRLKTEKVQKWVDCNSNCQCVTKD